MHKWHRNAHVALPPFHHSTQTGVCAHARPLVDARPLADGPLAQPQLSSEAAPGARVVARMLRDGGGGRGRSGGGRSGGRGGYDGRRSDSFGGLAAGRAFAPGFGFGGFNGPVYSYMPVTASPGYYSMVSGRPRYVDPIYQDRSVPADNWKQSFLGDRR